MKRLSFAVLAIITILMTLAGCASREDKIKDSLNKKLTTKYGEVKDLTVEVYDGFIPAILDKKVLDKAEEIGKLQKQGNNLPQFILDEENNKNYFMRDYFRRRRWDAQHAVERLPKEKDKLKETIAKIESNRPDQNRVVALIEYTKDNGSEKDIVRDIVVFDQDNFENPKNAEVCTEWKMKQMLTAIQVLKSDTIIINPNKEQIKQIISLMEDPAIRFMVKDSIN